MLVLVLIVVGIVFLMLAMGFVMGFVTDDVMIDGPEVSGLCLCGVTLIIMAIAAIIIT